MLVNFVHNRGERTMATAKRSAAKEIWDTLSRINVNEHTEDKGGLTYLSWAWAWSIMMDHYPDLIVKWHGMTDDNGITRDITTYPGGTASVSCSVTIQHPAGDVKREMWLPVMDYRNKAIANPDSRAISDAKQRCLTKCFGILGLGCYIYAGSDLPKESETDEAPKKTTRPKVKKAPKKEVKKEEKNYVEELKTTATDLFNSGWEPDESMKAEIKNAINTDDTEEAVRLIKVLKDVGAVARKLNDDTEEPTDA